MIKKGIGFTLSAMLLALSFPVEAQHAKKVYRIGYLAVDSVSEDLRQSLRELGYVEGQNLVFEYRLTKR